MKFIWRRNWNTIKLKWCRGSIATCSLSTIQHKGKLSTPDTTKLQYGFAQGLSPMLAFIRDNLSNSSERAFEASKLWFDPPITLPHSGHLLRSMAPPHLIAISRPSKGLQDSTFSPLWSRKYVRWHTDKSDQCLLKRRHHLLEWTQVQFRHTEIHGTDNLHLLI